MGNKFSSTNVFKNVKHLVFGRKRKYSEMDENDDKIIEIALHTAKRKKLTSTTFYIYKALFEEGKNSDVIVSALGQEFYLHKVYLCQSPYFASMFSGSWIESTKNNIEIEIVDPLITIESLKIVFGSLYNCEISLNPMDIVSILAAATMFQLDGLIEKCTEVMLETINPKTAIMFYNAACQYGNKEIEVVLFKWFLHNLMTYYFCNPLKELITIPINLMIELVGHPDLFVMQTEYSIYVMLKYWMFIMNGHNERNELNSLECRDVNLFYSNRKDQVPYLLCDEGQKFVKVFKKIRLQHLLSHQTDLELILQDNIIPISWLNLVLLRQWKSVLRVNQNEDIGPNHITECEFYKNCLRCGRILYSNERYVWRWTGFNFGIDLIMMTDGNTISIKRNHRSEMEQLLTFQNTRYVAIRVTVVKLNEQRQISYLKSTDIQQINLGKNEEVELITIDKNVKYPIIVSANILHTSPERASNPEDYPHSCSYN